MKKLYAVLWVDDVGAFPLNRKDVEWYHREAGPMSLAIESDDRVRAPLARQLKGMDGKDYASHHLHAVRWRGAAWPKRLHDSLGVPLVVRRILKSAGTRKLGRTGFRLLWSGGLCLVLAAAVAAAFFNLYLFAVLAAALFCLLAVPALWAYVQRKGNWEYYLSDPGAWQETLRGAKVEFESTAGSFPAVVRHGWNLPPEGSMEFYMREMSVLADASAVPTRFEERPAIAGRTTQWRTATPYYASMSGDYNTPWAGAEEDRGLLELPVVLGNIAYFGFGDREKEVLESLPEGGLASMYMHPWDDFSRVREWVSYLKANYEVTFLRADRYAELFMKKAPRPVLLGRDLRPRWAFLKVGLAVPVRDVGNDAVSSRVVARDSSSARIEMTVSTGAPLPLLAIEARAVSTASPVPLCFERAGGQFISRGVKPGAYVIESAF